MLSKLCRSKNQIAKRGAPPRPSTPPLGVDQAIESGLRV